MKYRNLPEPLRNRIDYARVKAERQFRDDERRLPGYVKSCSHMPGQPSPWYVQSVQARLLLIRRITTELLEDARAVRVVACNGEVKASDVEPIVNMILGMRCLDLSPDPYVSMGDRSYVFRREVRENLERSPEWDTHLTEMQELFKAAAEAPAAGPSKSASGLDEDGVSPPTVAGLADVAFTPPPGEGSKSEVARPTAGLAGSAPDQPVACGSESVFRATSEGRTIRYDGQSWSGKSKVRGLSLIRTLLCSPHCPISSEVLLGREQVAFQETNEAHRSESASRRGETLASAHSSYKVTDGPEREHDEPASPARAVSRPNLDATASKQARQRRDEVTKELLLVRESGNNERESELREEFLQLSDHLKVGPRGQLRQENSPQEKARKTAQAQFKRALKTLEVNGLTALSEHLRKSVRSGLSFTYQPKNGHRLADLSISSPRGLSLPFPVLTAPPSLRRYAPARHGHANRYVATPLT